MPAYYARSVGEFLKDTDASILGVLADANARAKFLQLESAAIEAWNQQFSVLRWLSRRLRQIQVSGAYCSSF
jgi:hypothetical protein